MESMGALRRTHTCNDLGPDFLDRETILMGWVLRRRDHGGVIFIDLRDRWGITQIVFNPEINEAVHAKAHQLRSEWVIAVRGTVARRPAAMENHKLKTGAIEVLVHELRILNTSETPPFPLDEDIEVSDTLRLQYRYLDLRRPEIANNLVLRHQALQTVRSYLNDNSFLEIETPMLTRSTPEGARDYLVPSRVNAGKFYALPQSPQLFKQILMVAGMDRYYQIVKCFRDEDLRADRQPEFTQIDIEMSFVDENAVMNMAEGLMATVFKDVFGKELSLPFPRMTYDEAMGSYGVGVSRAVAAVAETTCDDKGLAWPRNLAPFDVHIVATGKDAAALDFATALAHELDEAGVSVLLDDRKASPGVKFADAEVLGMPTSVVVGRTLADGVVEVRDRASGEKTEVGVDVVANHVVALVKG